MEQTEDLRERLYYVTIVDGHRVAYLYGPVKTHREALDKVSDVRKVANEVDPRSVWYAFGTSSLPLDVPNPPIGRLNERVDEWVALNTKNK